MLPIVYRLAKRTLDCLPSWLLRARPFGVYEIDLRSPPTQGEMLEGEALLPHDIRWLAGDELPSLVGLTSQANIQAFDPEQRRVAAASRDGRPIACAWIAREQFEEPELGLCIELGPREAWLFAASVAPADRGQGVYGKLLGFLVRNLREEGVERLLLGVATGNTASRAAHARQGARRVGGIAAARVLGLSCVWTSGAVRRASWPVFRWQRDNRLTVAELPR
jgi:GNAT superfamily N-acetyltransferase